MFYYGAKVLRDKQNRITTSCKIQFVIFDDKIEFDKYVNKIEDWFGLESNIKLSPKEAHTILGEIIANKYIGH